MKPKKSSSTQSELQNYTYTRKVWFMVEKQQGLKNLVHRIFRHTFKVKAIWSLEKRFDHKENFLK